MFGSEQRIYDALILQVRPDVLVPVAMRRAPVPAVPVSKYTEISKSIKLSGPGKSDYEVGSFLLCCPLNVPQTEGGNAVGLVEKGLLTVIVSPAVPH